MHRIFFIFILIALIINSQSYGQVVLGWDDLGKISFTTAKDDESGYAYMKPIFSEKVEEMNGKRVQITGYMIPLDTEGYEYVVSAYPNSACFFCGGAGKESVVELDLETYDRRYEVDEIVQMEGIFELNEDQFGLCYRLIGAKPVN
ncbi:MAG: DUF3299 domain-containing protein [Bacteroidota bacterium]